MLRDSHFDRTTGTFVTLNHLAEIGIVRTSLSAIAIFYAINVIINGHTHCRDRRIRGLVLASLLGILSFLIHGLVDFDIHIPANAAYFYALVGIGVSAS